MELGQAGILVSSLASKIMSAASLAKVGGAASGSVLAGLPSLGLTLSSKAALGPAVSALGSWLGTLNGFNLLGAPAAALTVSPLAAKATAAVVGGALTVGAVPVVLGAMGFTGAGITASSLAAKMMSTAAIANGGGVAAGSLVATLQSVGECPRQGLLCGRGEGQSLRGCSPDLSPGDPGLSAFVPLHVCSLGFSEGGGGARDRAPAWGVLGSG